MDPALRPTVKRPFVTYSPGKVRLSPGDPPTEYGWAHELLHVELQYTHDLFAYYPSMIAAGDDFQLFKHIGYRLFHLVLDHAIDSRLSQMGLLETDHWSSLADGLSRLLDRGDTELFARPLHPVVAEYRDYLLGAENSVAPIFRAVEPPGGEIREAAQLLADRMGCGHILRWVGFREIVHPGEDDWTLFVTLEGGDRLQ